MATQEQERVWPPKPPVEPVREGGRWRWHKPTSEQVAEWFGTQPLDENMQHADWVGGLVLIPQLEKVRYTRLDGQGMDERKEMTFTPYIQIGTRNAYFHRLAEQRGLIPVFEPVQVPRSNNPKSIYFNGHMPDGLWWHVVSDGQQNIRFLCSTWRVALYQPASFAAKYRGEPALPVREGRGTKQVGGDADENAIAKAETGAIGRALGVAGILVIGTGIATAEDMMELAGSAAPGASEPMLPETVPTVPSEIAPGEPPVPQSAEEELEQLRARCIALSTRMQEQKPEGWTRTAAWWQERLKELGAKGLNDASVEGLRSLIAYMERELADAA